MARHERRAEAGRKGRLRLEDAAFGASHFRRVAGEEMIHRLIGVELGDWRQHAEGVAGEHDDVARLAGAPRRRRVGVEVDRIGDARVLRQGIVVEIGRAGVRIENDVLHHRAEAFAGGVDLRLRLARQADRLGVAAAFEVEDAFATPAVLVVADQGSAADRPTASSCRCPRGRRRSRRRRRPAEIGRAMHRQHVGVGQDEVEIAEHRFLHFAARSACRRSARCGG